MDRRDAERVFELVADLSGDLKGRFIHERWWLVNLLMGIETFTSCCATQWLVTVGRATFPNLLMLWTAHLGVILLTIFGVHRKKGGQRTATEAYIWWIWTTFIATSTLVATTNFLSAQSMEISLMTISILAAFGWSMMAMITYRWLFFVAVFFATASAAMLVVPMPLVVFGAAWLVALSGLGLVLRISYTPTESRMI